MARKKPRFVIQEHQARNLHWDLRLEMNGVLKSWALPKEPPMKPKLKRLAIQVEDHPLDYIDFEGQIEEGSYGAGEVRIWDSGTYDILETSRRSISVRLYGRRLSGDFVLVKMNYPPGNQWLFMKRAADL